MFDNGDNTLVENKLISFYSNISKAKISWWQLAKLNCAEMMIHLYISLVHSLVHQSFSGFRVMIVTCPCMQLSLVWYLVSPGPLNITKCTTVVSQAVYQYIPWPYHWTIRPVDSTSMWTDFAFPENNWGVSSNFPKLFPTHLLYAL